MCEENPLAKDNPNGFTLVSISAGVFVFITLIDIVTYKKCEKQISAV